MYEPTHSTMILCVEVRRIGIEECAFKNQPTFIDKRSVPSIPNDNGYPW